MKLQRDPQMKRTFNIRDGTCHDLKNGSFELKNMKLTQKYPVHELLVTFSDRLLPLNMEFI